MEMIRASHYMEMNRASHYMEMISPSLYMEMIGLVHARAFLPPLSMQKVGLTLLVIFYGVPHHHIPASSVTSHYCLCFMGCPFIKLHPDP